MSEEKYNYIIERVKQRITDWDKVDYDFSADELTVCTMMAASDYEKMKREKKF